MELGVCYYPEHWPESQWATDALGMRDMGISTVRIAEFAWGRMEPEPGRWDFEWLDRAIETLAAQGLKIVLGTPTAAAPKWLVDRYPDVLAVGADGRAKQAGSRRHYCFSSDTYFRESARVVTAMAQRYGQHPAVIAWQTDNEYGCHDTILSYSPGARQRFRQWLQARYDTIQALNTAWNTVFWSGEYRSFDEVDAPVGTVTDALPAHRLDYRRFMSDEVIRYNRMQVDILRAYSPGRDVLHNFMAFFTDFDHYKMAEDLDIATWDNYPLGHSDINPALTEGEKLYWARTGHPDVPAFHHDLYRGMCQGRMWVMEQQAGPVNWASWNPIPLPGMVRLWTWEAFAHGAELVSYFRWRQCPFGQEQMHSGLKLPNDVCDVGGYEAARVAKELKLLGHLAGQPSGRAKVALVFDYVSRWQVGIQAQGSDFDYLTVAFRYYSALRRLGFDIDVVGPHSSLSGYALVVLPAQIHVSDALCAQLQIVLAEGAQMVLGARTGSKTSQLSVADGLPPGPLQALIPIRVQRVESLRPGMLETVQWQGHAYQVHRWREQVYADDRLVAAHYQDGYPAVVDTACTRYIAGWPDDAFLRALLGDSARRAGLMPQELGESLRLRRLGPVHFAFNVGPESAWVPAPVDTHFLMGARNLVAGEIAVWNEA